MSELNILCINAVFYALLLFYNIRTVGILNISSLLSCLYLFSSVFAVLLYTFPLYIYTASAAGHISIESIIYMDIFNTCLINSFRHVSFSKCSKISNFNYGRICKIQSIIVLGLSIYIIYAFPTKLMSFISSPNLSDMRDEIYGNNVDNSVPFIVNIFFRVFGSMDIFLLIISCLKIIINGKASKLDKISILIYIIIKLTTILGAVSRSTIIFQMFELFVTFLFFKEYISPNILKKIMRYSLIIMIPLIFIFNLISQSRFSTGYKQDYIFATLRYSGETQLNFAALAYPDSKIPFYGYKQFPVFRRILGLDYSDGTDRDGMGNEYIEKNYKYKHSTYIFYGLIGDFYLNWGKYVTLFLAIFVYIYFNRIYKLRKDNVLSLRQIILSIYIGTIVAKGIFFTDFRNESGNIFILFLIIWPLFIKSNNYIPVKKSTNI